MNINISLLTETSCLPDPPAHARGKRVWSLFAECIETKLISAIHQAPGKTASTLRLSRYLLKKCNSLTVHHSLLKRVITNRDALRTRAATNYYFHSLMVWFVSRMTQNSDGGWVSSSPEQTPLTFNGDLDKGTDPGISPHTGYFSNHFVHFSGKNSWILMKTNQAYSVGWYL